MPLREKHRNKRGGDLEWMQRSTVKKPVCIVFRYFFYCDRSGKWGKVLREENITELSPLQQQQHQERQQRWQLHSPLIPGSFVRSLARWVVISCHPKRNSGNRMWRWQLARISTSKQKLWNLNEKNPEINLKNCLPGRSVYQKLKEAQLLCFYEVATSHSIAVFHFKAFSMQF